MFKFQLGDLVRDRVTKFEGVITSRTQWLNGCIRYTCQSRKLKDGKPGELEAFDEGQLDLVKAGAVEVKPRPTGGPQKDQRSAFRA